MSDILPTSVQIQINQQFGKDSLNHSFYAAKSFLHILLSLLKSGFYPVVQQKRLRKHHSGCVNRKNYGKNTLLSTSEISEDTKTVGRK